MDRTLLVISTICFLVGFAYTMHALGARVYHHSRLNFFAILTGFAFQTAFLYERGEKVGRCPLTNLFEVFIFLAWSVSLIYLLIGPAYRLSLMGAFTAPLVFGLQIFALLAPIDLRHSLQHLAIHPLARPDKIRRPPRWRLFKAKNTLH